MQNNLFSGHHCRRKHFLVLPVAVLMALLWGCSAVQPVRVLERDQKAVTASLGGALVPGTSPMGVVPYLTAGYATGISDDVTLHGRAHLIMAAFGVAGVDVGASMRALRQDGLTPELTVSAQLLGYASIARSAPMRLYPNLTANASWSVGEQTLVYVGTHVTVQIDPTKTLMSPFAGYQFPVTQNFRLQLETIWQASNIDTRAGVFDGESSIGGNGSFGIYLGSMITL